MEWRCLDAPFKPEYRDSLGKAFKPSRAQSYEAIGVLSAQIAHRSGDEDAVSLRFGAQAKGQVYRGAEQVIVLSYRLSDVDPDAYPEIL